METLTFATSAEFMQWAQRIVKYKYQRYDRVPIGKQQWTYGDGHVAETEWGKRRGKLLTNLGWVLQTATGELPHTSDPQLVSDIDSRKGVVITINWGE